jgi:hypothetical protein
VLCGQSISSFSPVLLERRVEGKFEALADDELTLLRARQVLVHVTCPSAIIQEALLSGQTSTCIRIQSDPQKIRKRALHLAACFGSWTYLHASV